MSGTILYEGPSKLDGERIVAIAISRSKNRKTGDMVQTYILRADVDPVSAARSGADSSVCGDCKHRPAKGGACYVTLIHGPASVYRAYKRGRYPYARAAIDGQYAPGAVAEIGAGRIVRLGTYGDPAVVPVHIWEDLTSRAAGRTGYSHQWRNEALRLEDRQRLARLTMASVDNVVEAHYAREAGLRYFRIRSEDEPRYVGEVVCPASAEAGKVRTCATCKACSGTARPGQSSVVIIVHGSRARNFERAIP